jgi:hypothetical protein
MHGLKNAKTKIATSIKIEDDLKSYPTSFTKRRTRQFVQSKQNLRKNAKLDGSVKSDNLIYNMTGRLCPQ